ncbi:MAG: hypothetical protein H6Q69_1841 [Firmicutes bacterium]|nr:hypothetical protein [Bacillota bacterium]
MSRLKELSLDEKKESCSKYYYQDMAKPLKELLDIASQGPGDCKNALRIENKNDLLKPGYLPMEVGYCNLENGTAVSASTTKMPGVTIEMFEWWFAWHGLNPLRYKIWDPEDHIDTKVDYKERLTDKTIPMGERIWDTTHTVIEDIGLGPQVLDISFRSPKYMGFDTNLMAKNNVHIVTANLNGLVTMCHTIRPIECGIELRSRFWFGYNMRNGVIVKKLKDGEIMPLDGARAITFHALKEYSNLASILPRVYAEEKDKF